MSHGHRLEAFSESGTYLARDQNSMEDLSLFSLVRSSFVMVGDTGIESDSRHAEYAASCQAICRLTWAFDA